MIYISFHEILYELIIFDKVKFLRRFKVKFLRRFPLKKCSSFTPPPNEHQQNIWKQIENTSINIHNSRDNLMNLRKSLQLIPEKKLILTK